MLRPTKTRRTYRVDLDANCLEILTADIARAKARAEAAGVELDRSSFVFWTTQQPAPWKPNWVTKQSINYRTPVDVDCRLHDLSLHGDDDAHRRCSDHDGLRSPQPRGELQRP